jgi:uncharacterized RDD family membrane protein YckC
VEERADTATFGLRFWAFVVDSILANLLAILIDRGYRASGWHSLAIAGSFLLIEIVFLTLAGQTPGMRLVGLAVVREADNGRPRLQWVLLRTLLLLMIVTDNGRAMHDRAAGLRMVRIVRPA